MEQSKWSEMIADIAFSAAMGTRQRAYSWYVFKPDRLHVYDANITGEG